MGGPVSGSSNFITPKPEDTFRKDILRHVSRFQEKQIRKKTEKDNERRKKGIQDKQMWFWLSGTVSQIYNIMKCVSIVYFPIFFNLLFFRNREMYAGKVY